MVKLLDKRDYRAISLKDIDTVCNLENNNPIYAFGFPDISILGNRPINLDTNNIFQSNIVSLPVISLGKILDVGNDKPFFIGDIFAYHATAEALLLIKTS